jgi:hypothetical protein
MPPALLGGHARIYLPNGSFEDYLVSDNTTLADIIRSSPLAYLKEKHSNITHRNSVYLLEDGKEYDLLEPGTLLLLL